MANIVTMVGSAELARRLGIHQNTLRYWVLTSKVPQPSRVGRVFGWPAKVAAAIVKDFGRAPENGA